MAKITEWHLPMKLMALGAEKQFSGSFLSTLGVPQKPCYSIHLYKLQNIVGYSLCVKKNW